LLLLVGLCKSAIWGLDIVGQAAIYIDNFVAFNREAVQTLNYSGKSRFNCYSGILIERKDA